MKFAKTALCLFLIIYLKPNILFAHGWSEYPLARQTICYDQGNIWSGTPRNAACAAAKNVSGTYQFVQRNEFAINVLNFKSLAAVKAAVPDGTLCYANDPQKKGMGIPHPEWTRTTMSTGEFEYVFNATAPHNPSYWRFYLTKESADLTQALAWDDLELIAERGNLPVQNGKYRTNITIPAGREGDAILFVRWQRDDAAGEGFYNCSDITIVDSSTEGDSSDGHHHDDMHNPMPDLFKGGEFIASDLEPLFVGDAVEYAVIDEFDNTEKVFELSIDGNNIDDWQRLLAAEINGWYENYGTVSVFIGDWHDEMKHYMYLKGESDKNYFNSSNPNYRGELKVTPKDSEQVLKPLEFEVLETVVSDYIVGPNDTVILSSDDYLFIEQTNGSDATVTNNNSQNVKIKVGDLSTSDTLTFTVNSDDNLKSQQTLTLAVVVDASGETNNNTQVNDGEWDATKIYVSGDLVTHGGKVWKAHWWTRGGSTPTETYERNVWGVWRPIE